MKTVADLTIAELDTRRIAKIDQMTEANTFFWKSHTFCIQYIHFSALFQLLLNDNRIVS